MDKKIKITFLIGYLIGGGAEKVLTLILNYLDREKFQIDLICFQNTGNYPQKIPSHISIHELQLSPAKTPYQIPPLNLLPKFYKILAQTKPDVLFSFLPFTNLLAASTKIFCPNDYKVILNERIHLSSYRKNDKLRLIKDFLVKILYPLADQIVSVSVETGKDLIRNYHIPENKITTILNPVDIEMIHTLSRRPSPDAESIPKKGIILISLGRLVPQKNYFSALKAISLIKEDIGCYVILGKGEQDMQLKQYTKELALQDKVLFLGFHENPYPFLTKADIFVLSSLFEGFPNVLLEAMACGLPCISTNCPSGPSEIIQNNETGLLVPVNDAATLAKAIKSLITDKTLRLKLSEAAKIRAQDFSVPKITSQYEQVISHCLNS